MKSFFNEINPFCAAENFTIHRIQLSAPAGALFLWGQSSRGRQGEEPRFLPFAYAEPE